MQTQNDQIHTQYKYLLCQIWALTLLTVDEPNCCHGNGEKGVLLHGNLYQNGSKDEEEKDKDQATSYPHPLRYPGENNNTPVSNIAFYVIKIRNIL